MYLRRNLRAVWPPNASLHESSTCVHLRLLVGPFGQGFRMIGQIKVSSNRFRCVFVIFQSTSRKCSRNRSPSRLPVSPMYNFLQRVQVIRYVTLAEVQVKWSVILMNRLGPDNFSTLQMKRHVLHRARANLKVPGWSLVWNALLTKKLPVFVAFEWN